MKIKQSDISSDMNFRAQLRQYDGIKAFKMENDWYWKIDPTVIKWNVLEKQLAPHYSEEIKKLRQLFEITEIPYFKDLFADISKAVNPPKKQYRVEGDIRKFYSVNGFHIFTMMDNQNLNQTIRIKVPSGKIPPEIFVDKRVIVTGRLEIYSPYAQFQLIAEESKIDIIDECSRKQRLIEWAEDLKDILESPKKTICKPFQRVGVIGQKNSRGLTDFQNHLQKKITPNVEYKCVSQYDPLTTETILHYLAEFNAEAYNPCDYICIVRGGDDLERLLQYSEPKFVRAIFNSKIPVITGIAHDKDIEELLCDCATDLKGLNGGTPTGAAEILNRIAGREEKQKREAAYKQDLEKRKRKAINDKQRISMLEDECQKLRSNLDEAEEEISRLQQQLNAPKQTGFFSFLFGNKKSENDDECARLAKRVRELYAENQRLKNYLR